LKKSRTEDEDDGTRIKKIILNEDQKSKSREQSINVMRLFSQKANENPQDGPRKNSGFR